MFQIRKNMISAFKVTAVLLSLILSISSISFTSFVYATENDSAMNAFVVTKSGYSADYDAEMTIYEHKHSGGTVLYLDADDDEKFFSIAFKTPPDDSRGVPHVFEHAVLQGSKNYPVKSMFSILAQTSMATFLNAFTYSDFTAYPVASRNEKDYYNLMGAYLDAVFYPNILTDENIFKQEGIRIDADADGNLSYTGVVYSEMEGNASQPQTLLAYLEGEALFPDSHYRYNSGGNPADIQDLTYQQIKAVHKNNYTPENSLTVLYGHQDINSSLKILDSYFSEFEKKALNIELKKQEPFSETNYVTGFYPAEAGVSDSHMSIGYIFPGEADDEVFISAYLLYQLLMGNDQAPLSKRLYESGLADEYYAGMNQFMLQRGISFSAMNIDESDRDAFESLLEQSLREIAEEGFTQEYLDSIFNAYRFGVAMEKNYSNRGLYALLTGISGWMYEKDPMSEMNRNDIIASLKEKRDSDYFTGLIRSLILDNPHKAVCVLNPDEDFNAKKNAASEEKLKAIKDRLGDEGIEKLRSETAAFYKWQNTAPTKAQLDTMPKLTLSDVGKNETDIKYSIENFNGVRLIHTDLQTNGIGYVNICFDAQAIPQEKLQYAALAAMLMGNVATENYSMEDMLLAKNNIINGFGSGLETFTEYRNTDSYKPVISVNFLTLEDNVAQAMDLTKEIIKNSNFSDQAYVTQYLASYLANYQTNIESYALSSLMGASVGGKGLYDDYVSGYGFYSFLTDLQARISTDWDEIYSALNDARDTIFRQNNIVIGFTGDSESYKSFRSTALSFAKNFTRNGRTAASYSFEPYGTKTALPLPSQRLNTAQTGLISNSADDGRLAVVSNLIQMDYLWPIVREKNGAYGITCSINTDGRVYLYSYRDPNLTETLDAYKGIPEYLKNFSMSQEDLDSVILNAVSSFDGGQTGTSAWGKGVDFYFRRYKPETLNRRRNEMLSTTVEDVKNYAGLFEDILSQSRYVVTGADKIILENSDLFDKVLND